MGVMFKLIKKIIIKITQGHDIFENRSGLILFVLLSRLLHNPEVRFMFLFDLLIRPLVLQSVVDKLFIMFKHPRRKQ